MGLLAKVGRPFSCSFVANRSGLSGPNQIPILPGAAVPESLVSRPQLVALSDPRSTGVDGVNGNSRKMEKRQLLHLRNVGKAATDLSSADDN